MIRRLYTYCGSSTSPYQNLATERYFTEKVVDNASCILYLWQNENTVVIGQSKCLERMPHGSFRARGR